MSGDKGASRTDYEKTGKVESTERLEMIHAGGAGGGNTGPTGSKRDYAKKGGSTPARPHTTDFNPQKTKECCYAVGGV